MEGGGGILSVLSRMIAQDLVREIALTRSIDDDIFGEDAHCPHLGAPRMPVNPSIHPLNEEAFQCKIVKAS